MSAAKALDTYRTIAKPMSERESGNLQPHWDKQAPAARGGCGVNYSGSIAAGLRFEAGNGQLVAVDSRTIRDLFATLRDDNPLWDGSAERRGAHPSGRLCDEFKRLIADPWSLADPAAEARRFQQVLRAEGHELPSMEPVLALQPFIGHELLFFDRGNICLATLTALQRAELPDIAIENGNLADLELRFQFDVTPIPEVTWEFSSPFYVITDPDSVVLSRGYFYISMTNICIVTAPALVDRARQILRQERELRTLIPALRRCLSRR